jgi:hypothetical protein
MLRRYARSRNVFLVDVARDVVVGRYPTSEITRAAR